MSRGKSVFLVHGWAIPSGIVELLWYLSDFISIALQIQFISFMILIRLTLNLQVIRILVGVSTALWITARRVNSSTLWRNCPSDDTHSQFSWIEIQMKEKITTYFSRWWLLLCGHLYSSPTKSQMAHKTKFRFIHFQTDCFQIKNEWNRHTHTSCVNRPCNSRNREFVLLVPSGVPSEIDRNELARAPRDHPPPPPSWMVTRGFFFYQGTQSRKG